MIESAILLPASVKIVCKDDIALSASETAAQHGLPQGSLASPYVASRLIESALDQLPSDLVVAHVDDLFIGAKSEEEASVILQHLGDLLKGHPAGPLLMKPHIAKLGTPIDYLSYRIRRRKAMYGGGVRLTPSPKAFKRLELRAFDKLLKAPLMERHKKAEEYIGNWSASHRLWDRSESGDTLVWIRIIDDILPLTYKGKTLYT